MFDEGRFLFCERLVSSNTPPGCVPTYVPLVHSLVSDVSLLVVLSGFLPVDVSSSVVHVVSLSVIVDDNSVDSPPVGLVFGGSKYLKLNFNWSQSVDSAPIGLVSCGLPLDTATLVVSVVPPPLVNGHPMITRVKISVFK